MQCTIKDEVIKQMDDGKASSYKSYKNDLSVGDKFSLIYSIDSNGTFRIETEGPKDFSDFKYNFYIALMSNDAVIVANKKYKFTKALFAFGKEYFGYFFAEIRQNNFQIGAVNDMTLSMERYYKSDWMGIYTQNTNLSDTPITAHTYSFNCVHNSDDKWNEVFEKVMDTALSRTE